MAHINNTDYKKLNVDVLVTIHAPKCIRTKEIYKIVQIIKGLNLLDIS